jgi:hypothetical protein
MTAAADLSRESASPGERADGATSAPSSFTGPHRVAPFYVHVTMRVVALLREAKEAVWGGRSEFGRADSEAAGLCGRGAGRGADRARLSPTPGI